VFRKIGLRGTRPFVLAQRVASAPPTPSPPRGRRRLAAGAAVVVALAVAAGGCGGNGQSTLSPDSRASHAISVLWWAMLAGSAVVFGVVLVLVLAAAVHRRGDEPRPRWAALLGEPFVLVSGIALPALVLIGLFVATLVVLPKTSPAASPAGSAVVSRAGGLAIVVTGRQWFWDVEYPAQHVRSANEIHLPVGETVTLELRSADVVHSLWVPELNRKMDMIPGQTNSLRLRARRAGVFRGQCAEFCGLQHAHMALYVVAQPPDEFRGWLEHEARTPAPPATPAAQRGQQVFLGSACVYCHRIAGTNASGEVGPDLTHVASRLSLGAGTIPNTKGYLGGWILDPQHVKPGNRMPGTSLSGDELQDLLAYLETLR